MRLWLKQILTGRRLVAIVLYAGVALWSTWPTVCAPLSTLPLGGARSATVPLFNVWTIWWNADRAANGFHNYWHAPIFHPTRDAYAFSEPQPATIAVAPVVWGTGSRVLAYNLYLWCSLTLNAIFTERLLRRLGIRGRLAIGGGIAMLILPIVHWQLEVLQLVPLWGILWTWHALIDLAHAPAVRDGAKLGIAQGLSCWICVHQALLHSLLLFASVGFLPFSWRVPRLWVAALAAVALAAIMILPFALPMRAAMVAHGFERPTEFVDQLSALPGDYTSIPGNVVFNPGAIGARPGWMLSPGWMKYGLAALGIGVGLWRRKSRRWTFFLTCLATLAFLLSLGSYLEIGSWKPWWTIAKYWPGFAQVRNVFRFAFFVQMSVVILAAQSLHFVQVLIRARCKPIWSARLASLALTLLGIAALVETRVGTTRTLRVPDLAASTRWIDVVRTETPAGRGIACLPFSSGDRVEDYETTARWMYFGTYHKVPQVDGYSGFFPEEHFKLRDSINAAVIDRNTLDMLAASRVELLVVDRLQYPHALPADATNGQFRIQRIFEDPSGIDVYRISRISLR
jgi:hypothetical protein